MSRSQGVPPWAVTGASRGLARAVRLVGPPAWLFAAVETWGRARSGSARP